MDMQKYIENLEKQGVSVADLVEAMKAREEAKAEKEKAMKIDEARHHAVNAIVDYFVAIGAINKDDADNELYAHFYEIFEATEHSVKIAKQLADIEKDDDEVIKKFIRGL